MQPPRPTQADAADTGPSDLAGVGTYSYDIRTERFAWSEGMFGIYGIGAPPESEAAFLDMVHPDDRVRIEASVVAALEGGEDYAHEFRIRRPDGSIRLIHDRGRIERAADGTALSARGLNVDMTGAGAPLHDPDRPEDVHVFRMLADNINQLAWMADGKGHIYWYNKRWFEFTGTTLEAMRGWGWTAVHHPDHVDRVVSRIRASFETGTPWEDTFPLRGRDGRYRWFLSRAHPSRDPNGRITHWLGTNTDITEGREAEERLRRSEERFKLMADSMPQLVWSANADGAVSYYNKRVTSFAPVRDPETGRFDWALLVHPDDLERTRTTWAAAAGTLRDFSCEHRLHMADGTWRWHLSRAMPVVHGPTDGIEWHGTATDIHELKRLEEHRLLLSQELEHRIKNTLTVVQSIAGQTFRSLDGDRVAVDAFYNRIRALAEANEILVRGHWTEADVGEICLRTLGPLGVEERVELVGGLLTVPPRVGFLLGLGIHELATNAMKYGSLSVPEGAVRLSLGTDRRSAGFRLVWEERDGPPVSPPGREGFGSRLLKKALAAEIGGEVRMEFAPAGLRCEIDGTL